MNPFDFLNQYRSFCLDSFDERTKLATAISGHFQIAASASEALVNRHPTICLDNPQEFELFLSDLKQTLCSRLTEEDLKTIARELYEKVAFTLSEDTFKEFALDLVKWMYSILKATSTELDPYWCRVIEKVLLPSHRAWWFVDEVYKL